ncbi:hypothetical protein GC169_02090 [bacterium]|nr:hypothetical protein [bacterium]
MTVPAGLGLRFKRGVSRTRKGLRLTWRGLGDLAVCAGWWLLEGTRRAVVFPLLAIGFVLRPLWHLLEWGERVLGDAFKSDLVQSFVGGTWRLLVLAAAAAALIALGFGVWMGVSWLNEHADAVGGVALAVLVVGGSIALLIGLVVVFSSAIGWLLRAVAVVVVGAAAIGLVGAVGYGLFQGVGALTSGALDLNPAWLVIPAIVIAWIAVFWLTLRAPAVSAGLEGVPAGRSAASATTAASSPASHGASGDDWLSSGAGRAVLIVAALISVAVCVWLLWPGLVDFLLTSAVFLLAAAGAALVVWALVGVFRWGDGKYVGDAIAALLAIAVTGLIVYAINRPDEPSLGEASCATTPGMLGCVEGADAPVPGPSLEASPPLEPQAPPPPRLSPLLVSGVSWREESSFLMERGGVAVLRAEQLRIDPVELCGAEAVVAVGLSSRTGPLQLNRQLALARAVELSRLIAATAAADCPAPMRPVVYALPFAAAFTGAFGSAERSVAAYVVRDPQGREGRIRAERAVVDDLIARIGPLAPDNQSALDAMCRLGDPPGAAADGASPFGEVTDCMDVQLRNWMTT